MKQDAFKTYETTLEINGETTPVRIDVFVDEDECVDPAGDFDFGDDAENQKYLERFQSGELFIGVIEVRATAIELGEFESDVLGACHLTSNNMFDSGPFTKDVENIIEEHGMVAQALECLKGVLKHKINLYKPFIPSEGK